MDSDGSDSAATTSIPTSALKNLSTIPQTTNKSRVTFDEGLLNGFDASQHSSIVVSSAEMCYSLVVAHAGANIVKEIGCCSYMLDLQKPKECDDEESCCSYLAPASAGVAQALPPYTSTVLPDTGFWEITPLADDASEPVYLLLQSTGEPVSDDCQGPRVLRNMVLFVKHGKIPVLQRLLCELATNAEKPSPRMFKIFRYNIRSQYWRRDVVAKARPIESVVLPQQTIGKIVSDVDDFLCKDTRAFYEAHGIPYRRAYLFHGVPGAGKTSLIQAIAGHYGRSVCFLQPSHPDMTDESLVNACQDVPMKSIVVLEDVDALFEERTKKDGGKSCITFSGLLNALDGVGSPAGQIFVLTTNHRERLDPALIRNGRVDVHIEFTNVLDEQISGMFKAYYPSSMEEDGKRFAAALRGVLDGKELSPAGLQAYFVNMRKSTSEEAIAGVQGVCEEMNERASEAVKMQKEKDAKSSVTARP